MGPDFAFFSAIFDLFKAVAAMAMVRLVSALMMGFATFQWQLSVQPKRVTLSHFALHTHSAMFES